MPVHTPGYVTGSHPALLAIRGGPLLHVPLAVSIDELSIIDQRSPTDTLLLELSGTVSAVLNNSAIIAVAAEAGEALLGCIALSDDVSVLAVRTDFTQCSFKALLWLRGPLNAPRLGIHVRHSEEAAS